MTNNYLVISYCKKKEDEDSSFHLVSFDDNYNLKFNNEIIFVSRFNDKEEAGKFKIFLENIHKDYEFKMIEVKLLLESFI